MAVKDSLECPKCGAAVIKYKNPLLTVDIIIRIPGRGIVMIERKNPPYGWALPGGFVDYGESLEAAALREAKEETGLDLEELSQFRAYSDPERDPRHHTVTMVFSAIGKGTPVAADDAVKIETFHPERLPDKIAFDHAGIISDFLDKMKRRNIGKGF